MGVLAPPGDSDPPSPGRINVGVPDEILIRPRKPLTPTGHTRTSRPRTPDTGMAVQDPQAYNIQPIPAGASATEMARLRDSLDAFRHEFSGERRTAVEVKTKVESLYGPAGDVKRLEAKVDDLKSVVIKAVGWATGFMAAIAFLATWYQRSHH